MKIKFKAKNKTGFTLVELITVIVILAIVITIGINSISKSISSSKEKLYNEQIDRIINISKTWAIQNTNKLPEKNEILYVTLQNLRDENLLNGDIINPIDDSKIDGCVKITNNDSKEAYTYNYLESNNCPNENTIYNITYNLNGGVLEKSNPTTYTINTKTFTLNNPTKVGHSFRGWQLVGTEEISSSTKIYKGSKGDRAYDAIWESNLYIEIDPNGGEYAGHIEKYGYYVNPYDIIKLLEPTRENYGFSGWETSTNDYVDNGDGTITVGTTSIKFTAQWSNCIYSPDTPNYEYTGESLPIDDGDGHYRIKFLTSGELTLNCPTVIDVFLVGGGSSGGGSGKTQTYKSIELEAGKKYKIEVGAGGENGSDGTSSTAFGYTAEAGSGCNGGSGCGSSGYTEAGAAGGSDGSNGKNSTYGGTGQGSTTREFGEPNGDLYAGGGGGGTGWCWGKCPETGCGEGDNCYNGGFDGGKGGAGGGGDGASSSSSCTDGKDNTGGGAGLGVRGERNCSGGSGIVIIRNIVCVGNDKYCYTGKSEYVSEENGDWKIKLLTSGELTIYDTQNIDIFLVGGGSSGGGSGKTFTKTEYSANGGEKYDVIVGYGGIPGHDGTSSTAFGYTAEAGSGCNGGSGCGSSGYTEAGAAGGSDGSNGKNSTYGGGEGQGSTTREFGEPNGELYAGGGGGGTGWCWGTCPETGCGEGDNCYNGGFDGGKGGAGGGGDGASKDGACTNGQPNTGSGAGTGIRGAASCYGGSGIVIIRNTR